VRVCMRVLVCVSHTHTQLQCPPAHQELWAQQRPLPSARRPPEAGPERAGSLGGIPGLRDRPQLACTAGDAPPGADACGGKPACFPVACSCTHARRCRRRRRLTGLLPTHTPHLGWMLAKASGLPGACGPALLKQAPGPVGLRS